MILSPKRVLAIGAHPDDLELGCFGTLSLLCYKAYVFAVILSTLSEDGFGSQRIEESLRALDGHTATVTSVDWKHVDFVPNQRTVRALTDAVGEINPDLILTHTRWDTHQDHRAVADITLAACRRRPITILGYQTISTTPDFPANLWVDVSEVFDRKLATLRCFDSMKDQPYMQEEWQRAWHHDRTATTMGMGLVEAFHVYRMVA